MLTINPNPVVKCSIIDELSWDDGFGENKIYAKTGEQYLDGLKSDIYTPLSFPSYICEIPKDSILAGENQSLEKGLSLEKLIVEYNDKRYAVGKYALTQKPKDLKQSFEKDKSLTEEAIVKLMAGLAYLYPTYNNLTINELVVGLSVESFKSYRSKVEELYSNKSFTFDVLTVGGAMRPMTLKINNATCKCQGVGAFWDMFFVMDQFGRVRPGPESLRLKRKRFGIVDVGSKTIDAYISEGMEPVLGSEEVFDYGIRRAYKLVSDQLNDCPEQRIEKYYLDWLNTKENLDDMFWDGQYYPMADIVKLCREAFAEVGATVAQRIKLLWNAELAVLELIVICGGGALSADFVNAFKLEFKNRIEVASDPQFANCKGYVKSHKYHRIAQGLLRRM